MSSPEGEGEGPKFKVNCELSYQNKTCSECQQDVRKTVTQADRQTDRQTERKIEDRKTFQLSYQNKNC